MKLFISYRRSDADDAAGRLADRLADKFGAENVYKDVDSVLPGTDFRKAIEDEISQCDAVLAVIGPNWVDRAASPRDLVRSEIEAALAREIPVVPVLVSGGQFPKVHDLPKSLHALAMRNAASLRSGPEFRSDVDRLIEAIQTLPRSGIEPADLQRVRVFVSHSSLDRGWVESEVVDTLHRNSIETWYSKVAIKKGAQWEREIRNC